MPTSTPNIHLFVPGQHTSMAGDNLQFGEADLQASAAAYDPTKHEAPLVIGHPKHNAPAYGWVQSVQFADDGLTAIPHQINPDFAELHESGAFKKVSASFYHPDAKSNPVPGVFYLRHVGFLGAQAPAIKGLRNPEFSEGETTEDFITVEFSEPEQPPEEDNTVTPEEAAALEAKNKQLAADLAARDKLLADERAARAHADNVAFAEKLATDTRIGKDHVPLVAAVLTQLQQPTGDADKPVEFGEGDAAKPLHTAVTEMLEQLPERVEFGETATKDKAAGKDDTDDETVEYAEGSDPEAIALDKKIRAHMKQHKCDYVTAAHAVGNE
ncbi:MAG: peptidase [Oceanospirillaceae bacterium]|nr:peptidase [Oceanospirillaceae bacterium]